MERTVRRRSPPGATSRRRCRVDWDRPNGQRVWQAIEADLRVAYPKGPGAAVRGRLEKRRAAGDGGALYESDALETDGEGNRYALRLGCSIYPHMKLVVERAPDGKSHLFKADTHDRHCR